MKTTAMKTAGRRLGVLAACLVGVSVLAAAPALITELSALSPDVPESAPTGAPSSVPAAMPPAAPDHVRPGVAARRFSLLQMNLCLSGLAPCLQHPDALREAASVITTRRPDAVTLNEVCRGDVARMARSTGYHWRFTPVLYRGRRLPCVHPGGRGLFGNAVLTEATITHTAAGSYAAQVRLEQRRWLCVSIALPVTVCTTHLEAPISASTRAVGDRQCAELADLLAARARRGPTVASGDMNRLTSCAPASMWTRTDVLASQKPGVQHAYGSAGLRRPAVRVVPATSTDHDFLQLTARLARRPPASR